MAGHILQTYHAELSDGLQLQPSSGGVFEVTLDGALLFSKKAEGRFPEREEVDAALDREFATTAG